MRWARLMRWVGCQSCACYVLFLSVVVFFLASRFIFNSRWLPYL